MIKTNQFVALFSVASLATATTAFSGPVGEKDLWPDYEEAPTSGQLPIVDEKMPDAGQIPDLEEKPLLPPEAGQLPELEEKPLPLPEVGQAPDLEEKPILPPATGQLPEKLPEVGQRPDKMIDERGQMGQRGGYVIQPQLLSLDLGDVQYRRDFKVDLKRLITLQYPSLMYATADMEIRSVELVAKSFTGTAEAALEVCGVVSQDKFIPGMTTDFWRNYASTYHSIQFMAPAHGVGCDWALHVDAGAVKVRRINVNVGVPSL